MKLTAWDGNYVVWEDGVLSGDEDIVAYIEHYVEVGEPAGCDYWGQIEPSLKTEWEAYLTICGAIFALTGIEPAVDEVPENPDGYEPEGPTDDGLTASAVEELACHDESCAPPPVGTGGSTPGIAGLKTTSGEPLTREMLKNSSQYFVTLGTPETFSGWKAHVYADNVDDAIAILHRVRLDVVQDDNPEGWGAKVATQRFFDYTADGHKQAGKAVTLYFPKKANAEKDIEWLVREMEGIPKRQHKEIAGDEYKGNGVSVRYELGKGAPDRDLTYGEYHEYYVPA